MTMMRHTICVLGLACALMASGCVRPADRVETASAADAPAAPESSASQASPAPEPAAAGVQDFFGASLALVDQQGRALDCRGIAKADGQILVQRGVDKQQFVLKTTSLSAESRATIERFPDTRAEQLTAFVDERDFAAAKRSVKVEMISASWCGWCTKAKEFFAKEKIPYQVFDYESQGGKNRKAEWGSTGLPTVKIGGEVISGYGEEAYREALLAEYRKGTAS
jgi:glutaredoxin